MTTMMMTKMITNRRLLAGMLLLSVLGWTAIAQEKSSAKREPTDAVIFVTVVDGNGHFIYGVDVRCRRATDKKPKWQGPSDHRGEVAFHVPSGEGDYVVWAALKDKAAALKTESKVHISGNERTDVFLHLN